MKTIRRFHNRKTEHFKALSKRDHPSTGARALLVLLITLKQLVTTCFKWDHFDILASDKFDYHCKVKETLFIQELQPINVSIEKLLLHKESSSIVSLYRHFPLKRPQISTADVFFLGSKPPLIQTF